MRADGSATQAGVPQGVGGVERDDVDVGGTHTGLLVFAEGQEYAQHARFESTDTAPQQRSIVSPTLKLRLRARASTASI